MPIKDAQKRRDYNRIYQRERRAGNPTKGLTVIKPNTLEQTKTAQGLLAVLGQLIGDVLNEKTGDVYMRARCAGYLIAIGLKAVEVADLEARVNKLENKIMGTGDETR